VVDAASISEAPIAPKRNIILKIAFGAGLLLAFLYVYIRELLNNRVRSTKELKTLTSVPVLAEIAQQETGDLITANSRSIVAEQIRSLRTNLQYLRSRKAQEGGGRVTLLTSSMSAEGKSFIACNLAVIHAFSHKKTVLLELDLRKPKISRYLNLGPHTGLSNYLIGEVDIAGIIQPLANYPKLSVIGSGPVPPNPSELLAGDDMDELMAYLKANYDEIIIDTPPAGLVTDAQLLGRFADVTLFLVRQGVTFKSQVENINELQKQERFPKLNIILNGVKIGGGYGYGYGYYASGPENNTFKFSRLIRSVFARLF
jgi:capsular exopolysaccharide synthesis family protein